jgi:hypothetical protein
MKQAIDIYKGVRAIAKEEALGMIPMIFDKEWGKYLRDWDRLEQDWTRLNHELDRFGKERYKLNLEWDKLNQDWNRLTRSLQGYSPDRRAINFIAADHRNAVYCFVYCTTRQRNELWLYNGDTCPDAKGILNRGQVIWFEEK